MFAVDTGLNPQVKDAFGLKHITSTARATVTYKIPLVFEWYLIESHKILICQQQSFCIQICRSKSNGEIYQDHPFNATIAF